MNFEAIFRRITRDTTVDLSSIHGLSHWARVERNGRVLAPSVGADIRVVRLFAYFHDCRRLNDSSDPGHGPRAAQYVQSIRALLEGLEPSGLALLVAACEGHTHQITTQDPTIGVCWDADRLDLPRVGIRPKIRFFHTKAAMRMVADQDYSQLSALRPVLPGHS